MKVGPLVLSAVMLLGISGPAWACNCLTCKEAHASAMSQALTTIDAQKPIPANSVTHVIKNQNCENQLGNYSNLLNTLQELADESNSQVAQTLVQLLQSLLGQTENACGGPGGTVSTDTTDTQWETPTNPQGLQNDINPQGGNGNANFQNLFQ
jgi:hypothetical protein